MAEILDVTDSTFESEVLQSDTPVIVDFWAEWCQPCRQIAPIIETLADDYAGRVKVVKVNVDDSQHVAGNFGIRSIPAVLSFRDGQVVDQLVGVRPKANSPHGKCPLAGYGSYARSSAERPRAPGCRLQDERRPRD